MQKITPFLCFDGQAESAARFYTSLLPDSRVDKVTRSPADYPSGSTGSVLTVEFTLCGMRYVALNAGPQFKFTEAFSIQVHCDEQAEVDRLWDALTADGGKPSVCGWLKDRWGLSWQITPRRLMQLMSDPDRTKAAKAMQAMMKMAKIDIAELERAVSA